MEHVSLRHRSILVPTAATLRRDWAMRAALTAVASAALLSAGCSKGEAEQPAPAGGPAAAKTPATDGATSIPVEVIDVTSAPFVRALELPGRFVASKIVRVGVEVPGHVVELGGEEGQRVEKGDTLIRLDSRQARATIAQVDAQIRSADVAVDGAQTSFNRAEKLAASEVLDQASLDAARTGSRQAKAAKAVAQAAKDSALVHLARHEVKSPLNGVILSRRIEVGENANPGIPLVEVAVLDPMKLVVDTPEAQIHAIHEGASVQVRVPSLAGKLMVGKVKRVPNVADSGTRTFAVEVEVDNPDSEIRGGMMARVELELGHVDDALLVPLDAVIDEASAAVAGGASGGAEVVAVVYVVEGGKAQRRIVEAAETAKGKIRIASGLRAGDKLIVVGQRRVVDGDAVRIVEPIPSIGVKPIAKPDAVPVLEPAPAEGSR